LLNAAHVIRHAVSLDAAVELTAVRMLREEGLKIVEQNEFSLHLCDVVLGSTEATSEVWLFS